MGLFQLVAPILMLAFSLTCFGTQTAISKYTAFCLGIKNEALAKKYLLTGCILSLFLSLLYSIFIFSYAENISIYFLQEKRCAPLLRVCALSFPFSSLHACFNGFFYGSKNTTIPSFTQITEQIIRVGSVFLLYRFYQSQHLHPTITLTCIGMLLGEIAAFLISFLYYLWVESKHKSTVYHITPSYNHPFSRLSAKSFLQPASQIIFLAFPLTLNRVIVNLLQSYEAISIPQQLKVFGYSDKTALSIYGVLTGMAFSLVLFPSTFANSLSVLLLPTISEASSKNNNTQIHKIIKKTIAFSLIFGFFCTSFFLLFGNVCGTFLFKSSLAGTFICQLSFLCPFLYLHTTLASILNGLQKTTTTLLINVFSLLLRLFFILYYIPSYGIQSYIWGLLLSELLSSFLCLLALKQ